MKIPNTFVLLFAALAAFGAMTPTPARADVSVSFFYDTLDPYGEWIETPDYGYVWHPTGVDENWAPYTDGYWAYTDSGWTWVSYEDYGGVVYHYGRWTQLADEGWVWVPGNTWAPAWVSWRVSDDYVGWAPLPPEARWRAGFGFGGSVDAQFDIGPGFYSFVGVRDFGAPALGQVIISRDQNLTIINNTTNITNITVNNSNVYVGGPSYSSIAARSSRPIPTLKLVRQGDASLARSQGGKVLARQQGNQLMVLAPKITPTAPGSHIVPSKVAKTLTSVKADNGWGVVKDPQQRQKLEAQFKSQAGNQNTAAKPVNPEDVKLVSEKIKSQPTGKPLAQAPANPTPKPSKNKAGKAKTPSSEDLLNTPATEEPGTATASPTPKSGKKSKKSNTPAPQSNFAPGTGGSETPIPKSKNKKSKTPTPAPYDAEGAPTPPKRSKGGESNLQPFMTGGGEESSEPKSTKSKPSEYGSAESKGSEGSRNFEERAVTPGSHPAQPQPSRGDKKDKGKNKGQQGATPGQY